MASKKKASPKQEELPAAPDHDLTRTINTGEAPVAKVQEGKYENLKPGQYRTARGLIRQDR